MNCDTGGHKLERGCGLRLCLFSGVGGAGLCGRGLVGESSGLGEAFENDLHPGWATEERANSSMI